MITLYAGTAISIDLKNPIFGDTRQYDNHRIINKSIYDYSTFAQNAETPEFLTLTFSFETMDQYDDFVDFLANTIGQQVSLITHDGLEFDGVVVGPFVYTIKRDGVDEDGKKCTVDWGFTFEVETL